MWECRPKCTCGPTTTAVTCSCPRSAVKTPVAERDRFVALCRHRTASMPSVFFLLASMALQVGVLLLVDNGAHAPPQRHVHDFGTQVYPWSMVIIGIVTERGYMHYESVGLRRPGLQEPVEASSHLTHQLLFPRSHPLLMALVLYPTTHDPNKTMREDEVIQGLVSYQSFPALDPSTRPPDPDAPSHDSDLLSRTSVPRCDHAV